ncbi:MAG TPA: bifunctional serine/threonine-protein kinase/formylglycine-generating enzyme family protein [Candidatus Angelobacter sp.]|nr:bifunctional serine/threonine-protein kinase/formylglycine-generating enzyme family protein [Candidatus Angelobacter sp.]
MMMLKCTKCGRLHELSSTGELACNCSEEKTEMIPATEAEITTWHEQATTRSSEAVTARILTSSSGTTHSVLSGLGLGSGMAAAQSKAPADKYEYMQSLGAGGMGEVVRAWDRDLRRFVAVKRMKSSSQSRDAILRFVQEAQITGVLEHPNIVPVHDLGIDAQGRIYFSLKLIEGESLRGIIDKRKQNAQMSSGVKYKDIYTPLRMVEIFISVCQAVAYAHAKGIIHRDIKPENIMLGRYGEVLVVDWGIAKVVRGPENPQEQVTLPLTELDAVTPEKSLDGAISGTPAYMSPEQAMGRISSLDERSDIYALGAVLYHILAGRPPYEGSSAYDVLRLVQQRPPRALGAGSAGFEAIPRELKAICNRAMAREPESRYSTAEELRDDLQAYLEDRPVSACPDSRWRSLQKWLKRNRKQARTIALTAVTAVVVLASAYYGVREWRVRGLLRDARTKLVAFHHSPLAAGRNTDPTPAYDSLNVVLLDLQRALDLQPGRSATKAMLSDTYMEQWRLAMSKENFPLADNAQREVVRYEGGEPNRYSDELNGSAIVAITPEPAEAQLYIFKFVPVESKNANGATGSRLIPVPWDFHKRDVIASALQSEALRAQSGPAVLPGAHTIFNLAPPSEAMIPAEEARNLRLPPGSYMVLAKSPNKIDTRVPIFVPRFGRMEQTIHLPSAEEMPPGFFYVAGGTARIGGDSANALPERSVTIAPFLIYHDEISMGDYAEYLKDLVAQKKRAEADARTPRDFGKKVAILGKDGSLSGINVTKPKWFLASAVRGISFSDIQAYIQWRSQRDGLPYRLPTEFEWESTCRGADGRRYSWGNQYTPGFAFILQGYNDTGGDRSWHWEDFKDESPWGVHDLAGGVAEWTSSTYNTAAQPGSAEYGQFAIRGNAWSLPPVGLECAFRTSGQPDYFHPTIGFRLALDYPAHQPTSANPADAGEHQH